MNNIRNAVASDASNVGFVHYTCWLDTYKNLLDDHILDSITLRHSVAIFEKEACHNMIVYEDEGHIVAFLGYVKHSTHIEIKGFYVLPVYQRRGIGHQLLTYFINLFSDQTYFMLKVLSTNEKAITFYKKMGFFKIDHFMEDFKSLDIMKLSIH